VVGFVVLQRKGKEEKGKTPDMFKKSSALTGDDVEGVRGSRVEQGGWTRK